MEGTEFIVKALEYYDNNREKYDFIFKNVKYYRHSYSDISGPDVENNIIFYDKDKNYLFESHYQIIGGFSKNTNTWIWGWAMPLSKSNTLLSRKLWEYGENIDPLEDVFLRANLITSRFRISNKVQIDIYFAIAAYLTKNKITWINVFDMNKEKFNEINNEANIEQQNNNMLHYIFLTDMDSIMKYVKIINKTVQF